jgi:UDP-N-acetylmuramoyl-tripeptide--D-alanyl-D-alanine ligase
LGAAAALVCLDALVAFGRRAGWIADAAIAAGLPEGAVLRTDDPAAARRFLRERSRPGDVLLFKASRGTRLERVVDPLVRGED